MCLMEFFKLFTKKPKKIEAKMNEVNDTPMISIKDYLTAGGDYPDRANHPELTEEHKENAKELLKRVEALLKELGIDSVKLTSGWRPVGVKGGAVKSAHMEGKAIDIFDDRYQTLAKRVTLELLVKYDLYREDYDDTRGQWSNWVHLQSRPTKSGKRIFKP